VWLFAAEAEAGGNSLIVAVFGLLGTVVVTAGGLIGTLLNSRRDRTTPSPPPPDSDGGSAAVTALRESVKELADDVVFLRERTAVHGQRLDDHDDVNHYQDKRLDAIERAKDLDHPGWRNR
jgi:hypothetical protein